MNPGVQVLSIDAVAAGAVLADALRDSGGAVLLPAGAVLTDAALKALRRRGVTTLGVLNILASDPADNADSTAASLAERERQCTRLARLFRNSDTSNTSGASGASGILLARLLHYRRQA